MDRTDIIAKHSEVVADLIRAEAKRQKSVWQTVPHWLLESQGRPGWNNNGSFILNHRLYPIDGQWPPRVLVDCSAGDLVDDKVQPASSTAIVSAYLKGMRLDASATVADWMKCANEDVRRGTDPWRIYDDTACETLRTECNILPVCTEPATPVKWRS